MKPWKCDAVGPIEGLPEMLRDMFPEDDDRRFAQLGPDILDDRDILDHMEEVPDEVTIAVVGLPVLEPATAEPADVEG